MSNFGVIRDDNGNIVGVSNNALDVHVKHIHGNMINRYVANFTVTTDTLNGAVASGDTTIVTNAATFADGDWLELVDGTTEEPNFVRVTAGGGTANLTLDRQVDNGYADGSTVTKVNPNLSSVGTLGAPIIYRIKPPSDEIWHIERILLTISDATNTTMTIDLFGNIAELINGVVIRKSTSSVITTLTNWKKNADFYEDGYDVDLTLQAPGTEKGMAFRWTFRRSDTFVLLDGSNSDYLEVLVQDDITNLDDVQIKAQGHKV